MFKELKGFGGNLFEAEFAKNVKNNYASHILVKLVDFDWSFIREEAKNCYSKNGQSAFDPVLMFKILFLKEAMQLNSDYQLEELINLYILFRFFLNVSFKESNDDYVYARSMRCMVEVPFAVGKRSYRLKRSRYWGELKTHAQSLLTYMAYNLKKIFAAPPPLEPAATAA